MNEFESNKERVILTAVKLPNVSREITEEHLSELEMLAETADAFTVLKVIQDRARIEPAFYIGKGKAEEITELAELNDINTIIFDDDLTPTQVRNLEQLTGRKIVDRSGLILDIFASHARTREAKTQVELAQLQYMLPRLTRAWTHLSKQFGGIGTKGPGETQIETDRRLIRTRISKLKSRLGKIETQNRIASSKRKKFINASLVGYTNAGKSTLLNLLTDSKVLAENKLFATLDSTTRALRLSPQRSVMLSDTVGFIRKLPHNLIASFKSTLNVVRDADIVIHLIDITHPFFEEHISIVENTLEELGADKRERITVFNKVDALSDKSKIEYVRNKFPGSITISAQRGINVSQLTERIIELAEKTFVEQSVELNIDQSKLIARIHSLAEVLSEKYTDEKVKLEYRASRENSSKIMRLING